MTNALFTQPQFNNDEAARDFLEAIIWPNGTVCPHCGGTERNTRSQAASHRPGVWNCGDCRSQFTVTVGTVFERSKVPLHKWVLANHLMCSSKKGMSALQLQRTIGVTYKTAWFMFHRLREAMAGQDTGPMGEGGGTVEIDETYWGNSIRSKAGKEQIKKLGHVNGQAKQKIIALVERNGAVRGFHVASVNGKTLKTIMTNNICPSANIMTDDYRPYRSVGRQFASHQAVNHSSGEYVRGNAHTNTIEGFFSILKRGLVGTFHHVAPKHLNRYVGEFAFRYIHRTSQGFTDVERAAIAIKGAAGKRLTYRLPAGA